MQLKYYYITRYLHDYTLERLFIILAKIGFLFLISSVPHFFENEQDVFAVINNFDNCDWFASLF